MAFFPPAGDVHCIFAKPPKEICRNLKKGVALDRVSVVVALPVTQGSRQGVTVKQP
jgi:hypothetical protein